MEGKNNYISFIHTTHSEGRPREVIKQSPDNTIGVILLNLGGPDSLQAVRPFLYNLFSDREIIRLGPAPMQKPIAWIISTLRSPKTEKMYGKIGGKSPILDITQAQARALEDALNKESNSSHSFKVYIGMRYWHPLTEDVVGQMSRDGIKKVIGMSLYPQYSSTTSGSSLSQFRKAASRHAMDVLTVDSWHDHPLYIEALVDIIKKGLLSFSPSSVIPYPSSLDNVHVLFSAHSLPQKIIDEGDPYVDQIMETIREIEKRLPIRWHIGYQSKSGPVKWLEPSTEDKLRELSSDGIKNVLIVPISFVSDHIETLYEIDILYQNLARELGVRLIRSESLNTHPMFIDALRDIVLNHLKN